MACADFRTGITSYRESGMWFDRVSSTVDADRVIATDSDEPILAESASGPEPISG